MRMTWSKDKGSTGPKKRQSVIELLFTSAKMHWWLLGVIFVLAVTWIAFPMEEQRRLLNPDDFKLSKKGPRDVFAQVDATYYDEAATEEKKRKDLTEVPPVFDLSFQRLEDAKEEFNIVRQVRANYLLTDEKKVDEMERRFYIGPSEDVGRILATASDEQIDVMEKEVIRVLSNISAGGVVRAGEDGGSFAEKLSKIDYIKPKWERIRKMLERQTGRKPTNTQIAAKMHVRLVNTGSESADEKIVLVEEPEAHFHPGLQRQFIRFLMDSQSMYVHQYLIASHSNVFIDELIDSREAVFHVRSQQDDDTGKIYTQVDAFDRNKAPALLRDLGVRPSDLLLANGILVVEGPIDKEVYMDWAKKVGCSYENLGIEVIDV